MVVTCAVLLGGLSLTCAGSAVEQWSSHRGRAFTGPILLICLTALFGSTAMSFVRRGPGAPWLAGACALLLIVYASGIAFLLGIGYDVDRPKLLLALAGISALVGGLTILSAVALKRGGA